MAAGQGYIEFATGDVLTAAAANGYLASQVVMVFASSSARTAAIASPQEGMISYLKDTNSTEYYSGSAWVAIGGSSGGLTPVASSSPSAVSSVSINNCFSSTYKNYLILANFTASANGQINMRLRASGTDNTSSNYVWNGAYQYIGAASSAFTTVSSGQPGTQTQFILSYADTGGENIQNINVYSPQASEKTTFTNTAIAAYPSTNYMLSDRRAGIMTVSTSYDGFTLFADSGTITGTIKVYGYGV